MGPGLDQLRCLCWKKSHWNSVPWKPQYHDPTQLYHMALLRCCEVWMVSLRQSPSLWVVTLPGKKLNESHLANAKSTVLPHFSIGSKCWIIWASFLVVIEYCDPGVTVVLTDWGFSLFISDSGTTSTLLRVVLSTTFAPQQELSRKTNLISMRALRSGFCQAIQGVLRVKEDGLVAFGPPCGSYAWINRSTSGRRPEKPYGFEHKPYVERASMRHGTNWI